ncbi:MAG: hypothetical protein ACRDAM_14900 [Casimicrobium sp.]
MRPFNSLTALWATFLLAAAQPAFAATLVWDGGQGTTHWSDANN